MRFAAAFLKSMRENFRDWKLLLMTLSIAPFFVVVFYLFLGTSTLSYKVTVCNNDMAVSLKDGKVLNAGADIMEQMEKVKLNDSGSILKISRTKDLDTAKKSLEDRNTDIIVVFPEDMSKTIKQYMESGAGNKADITVYGDPTRSEYIMAAVLCDSTYREYVDAVTGKETPVGMKEVLIGGTGSLSGFDASVPSALIFAIIMVLFSATASIIKEVDKGTIRRLKLTRLTPFEFLASIGLTQLIINAIGIALTLAVAMALGYRPIGSYLDILIVGTIASLPIIAISLILAAFCRNVNDVTILGNIPFFLLLFFSGGVFTIPRLKLFDLGSHMIALNDILPTTPATAALGKVLNLGTGLSGVCFELAFVLILTLIYFVLGLWLFNKKHMKYV